MAIKFVDRVPTRPGRIKITPEDGSDVWYGVMERADEPSVEGTPINAANLNAMQENQGMSGYMTVYVAPSGSDSLGTGLITAPYATITKAVSVIPKQLNGYTAMIYIESGVYPEKLTINGFSGGTLMLTGVVGASISVSSLSIQHTEMLIFRNLNFNVIGGDDVLYGVHATGSCMVVDTGSFSASNASVSGIYAILGSTVYLTNLSVSAVGNALTATNGAQIIVGTLTGTATESGMRVTGGGRITFGSSTLTAPTMYVTASGGRILTGAQSNIPNY